MLREKFSNSLLHGPVVLGPVLGAHPPRWEVQVRPQERGDVVALVVEHELPQDGDVGRQRLDLGLDRA